MGKFNWKPKSLDHQGANFHLNIYQWWSLCQPIQHYIAMGKLFIFKHTRIARDSSCLLVWCSMEGCRMSRRAELYLRKSCENRNLNCNLFSVNEPSKNGYQGASLLMDMCDGPWTWAQPNYKTIPILNSWLWLIDPQVWFWRSNRPHLDGTKQKHLKFIRSFFSLVNSILSISLQFYHQDHDLLALNLARIVD